MSAGETCTKVIVVTINLIFLIFGLAALVAGIVFKVGAWDDINKFFKIGGNDSDIGAAGNALCISAIAFGAFIVVLSIMGLIGACCKVKCLLVMYGIIVILLLCAEIGVVVYVGINASDIEDKTKTALKSALDHFKEDNTDKKEESVIWNLIFSKFDCCGAENYTDFVNVNFSSVNRPQIYQAGQIPIGCCQNINLGENKYNLTDTQFWKDHEHCLLYPYVTDRIKQGCVKSVENSVLNNKWVFIGVGIALFVIQILVIILAFCLCCSSEKDMAV